MAAIPLPQSIPRRTIEGRGISIEGRWRFWYVDISDYMIRNPGCKYLDIAASLGKHPNTISLIVNTDMFKEYHAQRKQEFVQDHDFALRAKLTDQATKGLDLILEVMQKQGDKIPLQRLESLATNALDRLGYGPKQGPQVVVQQNDNRQQTVVIPGLTTADLEAARMALRQSEASRAGMSLPSTTQPPFPEVAPVELGAESKPLVSSGGDSAVEDGGSPNASVFDP